MFLTAPLSLAAALQVRRFLSKCLNSLPAITFTKQPDGAYTIDSMAALFKHMIKAADTLKTVFVRSHDIMAAFWSYSFISQGCTVQGAVS